MQILVLEDNQAKLDALIEHIASSHTKAKVKSVGTFIEYLREVNSTRFDLAILDLVVPRQLVNEEPVDLTDEIVEVTRDFKSKNARTPAIALTSYDDKAEENFRALNQQDITVVNYVAGSEQWKAVLDRKIVSSTPKERFDFVIVCALPKEMNGFAEAGYALGDLEVREGLESRTLSIESHHGVVVVAPRMGLVDSAITSTLAIGAFEPQLVCMGGICAGVKDAAKIYDVVVAETCHQHDSGKWSGGETGSELEPEIYSVSIDHSLAQRFRQHISGSGFIQRITNGISLNRLEFPDNMNALTPAVFLAPAASGSAVIADKSIVDLIKAQQRKVAIIEMESYALYEAARLSPLHPKFFSAKCVVDDAVNKGDRFHRVGCVLSARVVGEFIKIFPVY